MKDFLKYTLATVTGIILTSILFFIIMLASISAIVAAGDKPVSINSNSVLVLKAGMPIPDRGKQNPLAVIDLMSMDLTPVAGLNEILENIRKAAKDDRIKGILIENNIMGTGWATTEEIRNAVLEFRESGKFVISYSDLMLTQECYYLATAADKIFINPGSMVDFKGLSSEVIFFRNALQKLGVDIQVIRHGKFKGAVEPFLLDKLSEENKAQIMDYTGSIWDHVTENISEARNISKTELNRIADNLDGMISERALNAGLVDGLIFRDILIDTLKSLSGISRDEDLNMVPMTRYTKVQSEKKKILAKNKISVIYAEGNIVTGKGNENNIGGNQYADIIRKERKDSTVKAIVLRVNSPGGSANASDLMWRELSLAAEVKPVIVSMGNYAASGGYYISAPATRIFASPTTISGSIGVFGMIPNVEKLMEEKLGLNTEVVTTNKYSDFPGIFRPMSEYEKELFQVSIENIYADFVSKVASGRNMNTGSVDSIGQGRVWSGASAMKIGLVDEMGGLNDAIKSAAGLSGLADYTIKELPVIEDPYLKLLSQLSGEVKMKRLFSGMGEFSKYYDMIMDIRELSGIQARLPYFIEIH